MAYRRAITLTFTSGKITAITDPSPHLDPVLQRNRAARTITEP